MGRKKSVILTIDDEVVIRGTIKAYLEDCDYIVLEADNGLSGLEVLEREQVDLILLDLRMPVMDGLEFLSKSKTKGPEIPIIVISGTGDISDVVEALRLGAWDYLLKPIDDMNILTYSIGASLERARLMEENEKYQENLEELVSLKTQELSLVNTRLKAVLETSRKLIGCGEIDESSPLILTEFSNHMQAAGGSFYKVVEGGLRLLHSIDTGHAQEWIPFPLKKGSVFDRIMETSESLYLTDLADDETIKPSGWQEYKGNSMLAFPIADGRGGIAGIVSLHSKNDSPFLMQDREIGAILSSYAGEALQIAHVSAALKNSESHLRQAHKMEAIGTLAGGIAHDFNNILSAIIGYTDLSLYAEPCSEGLRRNLEQIKNASNRARDLVSQILAFSRTEEFKDDAVDIGPIVREALKLLRATIPSTIEIIHDIPDGLGKVVTDPTKVYQVLMNLCTNAAHAMRNQGGVLEIAYAKVTNGESPLVLNGNAKLPCLHLSISDTGAGMTPEVVNRIFDPYFTTKEKGDGTGLGLAVVHGIVRSSGGEITVESELGKGSTFHLYLPSVLDGPEVLEDTVSPQMAHGSESILFVDDETTLAEMAGHMLEKLGYTVKIMSNSSDALDLFSRSPDAFDLMVTDQTMPDLSGMELARKVLELRPKLPVILCTGYSSSVDGSEVKEIGIKQFIMKPLSMNALARVVRESLDE